MFKTHHEKVSHADNSVNSSYQPEDRLKLERLGSQRGLVRGRSSCDLSRQGHLSLTLLLSPITCSLTGDISPRVTAHLNNTGMRLATKTRCWKLLEAGGPNKDTVGLST